MSRSSVSVLTVISLSAALFLSGTGPVAAVPNDEQASAQVISGSSGSVQGSNIGASNNDVWYRWTIQLRATSNSM